jgi:hypothetical protein
MTYDLQSTKEKRAFVPFVFHMAFDSDGEKDARNLLKLMQLAELGIYWCISKKNHKSDHYRQLIEMARGIREIILNNLDQT